MTIYPTKHCNKCNIEKPLSEFSKDKNRKDGHQVYCKTCTSAYKKIYYKANREEIIKKTREWAVANPEKRKEIGKKSYETHKEEYDAQSKEWAAANPERSKEIKYKYAAEHKEEKKEQAAEYRKTLSPEKREQFRETKRIWKAENPEKVSADTARRRTNIKECTPPWADGEAIKEIYNQRDALNESTGEKHHVDHLFPLRSNIVFNGEPVYGLHTEWNLGVKTAHDNLVKSNKVDPI